MQTVVVQASHCVVLIEWVQPALRFLSSAPNQRKARAWNRSG
jgi:hypothetical protein